jgi:hypothetical protein
MSYERKMTPSQPAANDPKYVVIELRARIAELEAERDAWKEQRDAEYEAWARAEAELAELKARRCETCGWWTFAIEKAISCTNPDGWGWHKADFCCNCWKARASTQEPSPTHGCCECVHWWPNHVHVEANEGACQALGMLTKASGGGCVQHFRAVKASW